MGDCTKVIPILVTIFAHNEELRIAACLESLPLDDPAIQVHVVVNGSRDRTAAIARGYAGVIVHDYAEGGKARSWNRFVLDEAPDAHCYVMIDGDSTFSAGSVSALAATLAAAAPANACAGLPRNGRQVARYRDEVVRSHGLFGDLYALTGDFVRRMRASGIRLPDDLIGDDSLVGALVKTDLRDESFWDDSRITAAPDAGFYCEQIALTKPSTWAMQYKRMTNYSVRHFQNRIVSAIMRGDGPPALPRELASLYGEWLPQFRPRPSPGQWWFDRLALARMRAAAPD
jgi:glycosyltransferase involved in cell wall biosynthesis